MHLAVPAFIQRNIKEVGNGGFRVFAAKLYKALFLVFPALVVVLVIRCLRPLVLVRLGTLISSRLGHFAGNTELYLCERDAGINVPRGSYFDVFVIPDAVCNEQLLKMWKRAIYIWPGRIMATVAWINRLIPGSAVHMVVAARNDRDIHNLLDRYSPHLSFTDEEEAMGVAGLRSLGIPAGAKFVCLIVRDSSYLRSNMPQGNWNYHNYRDCNIRNFVPAAEAVAKKGYFVIRMGANVETPLQSSDPRIIDYAFSELRSDFLDIYLGAKCAFCITTGCGWDAVPGCLFRKPIVWTNTVPVGYLSTWAHKDIMTTKRHICVDDNKELTLRQIFESSAAFTPTASQYENEGVYLVENSPQELRDLVLEMVERIEGTWTDAAEDERLQQEFWRIYRACAVDQWKDRPIHGELRARFGAKYLRDNRNWLE